MNRTALRVVLGVCIALAAAAGGLGLRYQLTMDREQGLAELNRLVLPDPEGKLQSFAQWKGKVLVVNFWATWCDPCREEVPALVKIQQKMGSQGVQIVGIGIDSAAKMRQFAANFGINYPLAVAGLEAIEVSRKLGNQAGALPYTLILDRQGRIAGTHLGRLTEKGLSDLLRPLLAS